MRHHFRTAVLTIILTGGTMVSYATAYVMMPATPAAVSTPAPAAVQTPAGEMPAVKIPAGQTDVSVREVCADVGNRADRTRCMQAAVSSPSVRVIDMAATSSDTLIR